MNKKDKKQLARKKQDSQNRQNRDNFRVPKKRPYKRERSSDWHGSVYDEDGDWTVTVFDE
jgi:hypothetical protein